MNTETKWRGSIQLLLGLGITFLFFYMMAPFMVALLLGAVLAILCYPLFGALRRKKIPTTLSALIVTLGVALGALIPFAFVAVNAAQQVALLISKLRIHRNGDAEAFFYSSGLSRFHSAISKFIPVNREWLRGQMLDVLESILETLSRLTGSFLSGVPSLLLALSIVLISFYFFLVDGAKFLRFLGSLSPLQRDRSVDLFETFQRSCRGVVMSLLVSAVVQGFLIFLVFAITGIPEPILFGVLGVIFGMVPIVGTAPITLGSVIYLGTQGHNGSAIFALIAGVLIGTSDNIVRPWILKGQAELHPLLGLVSTFGAVNLMGATGIFLGPIIAAVFVAFLNIIASQIRNESSALGAPPALP